LPSRLEIVWPSGVKQTIDNIKPNAFVTVREGMGIASSQPIVFNVPK